MPRMSSGIEEFDRVLGGGMVAGGVVLIGGDPGIGKSTLLLQSLAAISTSTRVLYISGEESAAQIALRARRLGVDAKAVLLLSEISLERIVTTVREEAPAVVVVDSIQTVYTGEMQSAPGSVAQVRECAAHLTRLAKQLGFILIMVGHVTKDGSLAGPRVLEHMVDTVLYFEGDPHSSVPVGAGGQEPLWRRQRAGRICDDRSRPEGRVQSIGAVPVAARDRWSRR